MMVYDHRASDSSTHELTTKHYGDFVIGASFRFITTSISDTKLIGMGSQIVQSTYNALLPPYVYLGVGRSNNYIESLNSGFSFLGEDKKFHINLKTPIIPNSQMIVFSNLNPVETWQVELFTNPDLNLYLIMIACALVLFLIGILIIILHVSEKNLDKAKTQLPDF